MPLTLVHGDIQENSFYAGEGGSGKFAFIGLGTFMHRSPALGPEILVQDGRGKELVYESMIKKSSL